MNSREQEPTGVFLMENFVTIRDNEHLPNTFSICKLWDLSDWAWRLPSLPIVIQYSSPNLKWSMSSSIWTVSKVMNGLSIFLGYPTVNSESISRLFDLKFKISPERIPSSRLPGLINCESFPDMQWIADIPQTTISTTPKRWFSHTSFRIPLRPKWAFAFISFPFPYIKIP